jgi:hypothetical protein
MIYVRRRFLSVSSYFSTAATERPGFMSLFMKRSTGGCNDDHGHPEAGLSYFLPRQSVLLLWLCGLGEQAPHGWIAWAMVPASQD